MNDFPSIKYWSHYTITLSMLKGDYGIINVKEIPTIYSVVKCYRKVHVMVWLLTTQKPINRLHQKVEVCFTSDAGSYWEEEGVRHLFKGQSLSTPTWVTPGQELYRESGRELHTETAQSSLKSHLQIGPWWSDQHHLAALGMSYLLKSRGPAFVLASLWSFLELCAQVLGTVWSSCR